MSLTITIITTSNQTRSFQQSDPAKIANLLGNLKRCTQWFQQQSLVIIGNESTEIINPSNITRIEFDTRQDLTLQLPAALLPVIHAIPPDALTLPGHAGNDNAALRVDLSFIGGDSLAGWLETSFTETATERTMRNAKLFEESVITYTTQRGGIGFINPAAMTSARINAPIHYPPTTAWHADAV